MKPMHDRPALYPIVGQSHWVSSFSPWWRHQQLCSITSCILRILPVAVLSGYISNGGDTSAHPIQLSNFHLSELVNILDCPMHKTSVSSAVLIWLNEKDYCRKDHLFSFLLRRLETMWIAIWSSIWNLCYGVNLILFMMLEKWPLGKHLCNIMCI